VFRNPLHKLAHAMQMARTDDRTSAQRSESSPSRHRFARLFIVAPAGDGTLSAVFDVVDVVRQSRGA
jgi:hypothetical protein